MNRAIIDADDGLAPKSDQAITVEGTIFAVFLIKNPTIFTQENTFENVACNMVTISSLARVLIEVLSQYCQRDGIRGYSDASLHTANSLIWGAPNRISYVSHLVLQLSLCNILKPGVSREWRCSWSSADRRCSNYIGMINNFIAYKAATYIRGLTVIRSVCEWPGT